MPPSISLPDFLRPVRTLHISDEAPEPVRSAATALCRLLDLADPEPAARPGTGLNFGLAGGSWGLGPQDAATRQRSWMWARIDSNGTGELAASGPSFLYALIRLLSDGLTSEQQRDVPDGLLIEASFDWNRPLFDSVLTQVARNTRQFNPEAYVRTLAESGFTHLEVNSLAAHVPLEPGTSHEYYSQFYTYCAGFNHFVDSSLTRGLYPAEYLQANLRRLRYLSELGRRYGLKPGIVCFEPRTLPERFFQRYPTLRGARVDHPFRSHMPRYTLAQDHPVARDHYRQVVQNLMREVPDLSYLSIWTNDSGAGFEHTASLYVGRNGGPYLIREWRNHEKIAEAAGKSATRWLRLIQETAAETNPEAEVLLRIEPFKVEHDVIMAGMGDGLSVEAPSLLVRGYDLPYSHPRYPEQTGIAGTIFHTGMDDAEGEKLQDYRSRGFEPKLTYSAASSFNMEPLLGIPFPRMLHEKLTALRAMDARCVSAFGGLLNTEKTPFWPNPEVIRTVQLNPALPLDDVLHRAATAWAGPDNAQTLVELWDAVEEAVSYMPVVPLYSNFGFVWLRTWVRPLVPDIEAVPREDRLYYERFLVSTSNNPAINDLGRDVLFELISRESGDRMAGEFDSDVLPRLDAVLEKLTDITADAAEPARQVLVDLRDRVRALRCWATTQRNTCAWVAGVYGFLESDSDAEKERLRGGLQAMIDLDLDNTRELLDLWETADTEFILVSDVGETSFIYGDNLTDLLKRKIELTEQYRDRDPHIDRDIIWRLP